MGVFSKLRVSQSPVKFHQSVVERRKLIESYRWRVYVLHSTLCVSMRLEISGDCQCFQCCLQLDLLLLVHSLLDLFNIDQSQKMNQHPSKMAIVVEAVCSLDYFVTDEIHLGLIL